jgi:hypothetical protein
LNAPDLGDLCPTPPPPNPLPIPYPNTAHFAVPPATPVINVLFGPTDIDVIGTTPLTDLFIV